MLRMTRCPVIGTEVREVREGIVHYKSDRLADIAKHLRLYHMEGTPLARDGGWTSLDREPETGTFWESLRLQSHLQGGGAISVVPVTDEDICARYGLHPQRTAGQPPVIQGGLAAVSNKLVLDAKAKIARHLRKCHLVPEDEKDYYRNPIDGSLWHRLIPDRFRNLKTKPMTLIGVQNGDSVGELEAEEEKLRINLECPQSIEGKTIRRGRVRENEASAIARHLLDMHLLDQKKSRGGDRALYYDPWKQLYWELTFLESDTFGEGPPSLFPVPHEQVKRLYDLEPIPRREKVRFAGYTTDWLEPGRRYKDPSLQIIAHIAGSHLVKPKRNLMETNCFGSRHTVFTTQSETIWLDILTRIFRPLASFRRLPRACPVRCILLSLAISRS